MKAELEIPDYSPQTGLRMQWEPDSRIKIEVNEGEVYIRANSGGLVSLARLLLTLTQEGLPNGYHWHLDELNALEDGSNAVVIERVDSDEW